MWLVLLMLFFISQRGKVDEIFSCHFYEPDGRADFACRPLVELASEVVAEGEELFNPIDQSADDGGLLPAVEGYDFVCGGGVVHG